MNPNQSSLGRHAATDEGFKTADDGCGSTGYTEQNEVDEKIMQPFLHSSQAQDPSRSSTPIPQQTETYEKARGDSLVKQLFLDLDNSGESPRSSHEKIGNSIQTESGNAPSSTTNRNSSRHRSESFDDINGKGRISHLNIHNQRNYGNITRDGNSFVSNRRSMDPTGMFRNRGRHIVGTNSVMSSTVYSHNTRNVSPSSKPCSSPQHSTIGQATDSIKVSSFSPDRGSLPPSNIAQNSFESSPTAKNSDGSETYSRMVQDDVVSLPVSLQSECNHHNYVKSNGKESIRQHLRMTSNNFQLENHEGNQSHSQINFDHDRLREGRDKQICDALDLHSRPQSNLSIDTAQSMTLHQEPKQPVFSSETMLNLNESLIDGESSDNDDEVDRFDNGFIFNCDSTVGGSPEVGSNVRGGTTVARYGLVPKTSSATNTLDVIDASYDQTNKDDTISNNKSHCRYKSNENDPQSPAGSTVSVMGSVAADEDYSSLDEVRLVQTRLMQDVMEDDEDTRDEDGNIDVIKQEPSSKSSSNKIAQNMSNTVTPKSPATKAWKYHKIQSRYKGIERNSSLPNVQGGINAPGVDNGNTNTVTLDEPITTNNLPLPFQLARKCFSFEDTTTDDNYFLSTPHQFQIRKGASRSAQYQSYGLSAVASYPSDFENSQSATDNNVDDNARDTIFKPVKRVLPHPKWHPPDRARLIQVNKNSPFRDISRSQTWDNHKSSPPRPYKCSHHASLDGARRVASFDDYSLPPNMKLMRQDMIELGSKFMNTLSTDIAVKCSDLTSNDRDFPEKDIQFESTLKRVERDRDYAIQLLKEILEAVPLCDNYCEPVEIQPEEVIEGGRYNSSNASTSIRDLICDLCKTRYDQHRFFTCDECSQKLFTIVTSFKELIVAQDCNIDSNEPTSINKSVLPGVLDILMHSYEILKKIINTGGWIGRAKDLIDSFEENHKISSGRCSSITTFHSNGTNGSGNVGQTLGRKSTVSSMKKAKCIEAKTDISSEVLDQNIFEMVEGFPHQTCDFSDPGKQSFKHSKCQTEKHLECSKQNILLKAALKKANKTIDELQRRCYMFEQNVPFESDIDPIPKDPSYNNSEDIFLKIASDLENDSGIAIKIDDPALEKELEEYKEALLRSLDIPTRSAPTAQTSTVSNDMNGSSCQQQHTVNVKMIDSENFITEWSDLVPPLPPPPDHGLRSPIVDTILDQWTDDPETKESLISWMESIIEGANPELVPPLKLSGLSHQIRDGFVMHVLPLLLLRKDHHVHVASRAQRQTSYDIAVSISKTSTGMDFISSTDLEHSRLHKSNLGKHHNMAYRASSSIQNHDSGGERPEPHDEMISSMPFDRPNMPGSPKIGFNSKNSDAGSISTAITSPISNRAPSKKSILLSRGKPSKPSQISSRGGSVSYYSHGHESESLPSIPATCASLGDDLSASSASECDGENNRQKGKETIWGAFGGLLHRRKFIHSKLQNQNLNGMRSCLLDQMTTPSQEAIPFSFYSPADQEPHHRVVSAPPGKIGLTFVEHRGHTMVSSVSEGSPLTGFVFQGDILIAIDETPVSGLRTKEIVKLLTAMKDKHRALRMMSSHGMNELISPMSY